MKGVNALRVDDVTSISNGAFGGTGNNQTKTNIFDSVSPGSVSV